MLKRVLFIGFSLFFSVVSLVALEEGSSSSHSRGQQWFQKAADYPEGEYIQIQDGSEWQINPRDSFKLQRWKSGDKIEIVLNNGYFANKEYTYYISNSDHGSSIQVNLFASPIVTNPYTHRLYTFDRAHNKICLEDGSRWQIAKEDLGIFETWNGGDLIIIVRENFWLSWRHLLLNANQGEYVPAVKMPAALHRVPNIPLPKGEK